MLTAQDSEQHNAKLDNKRDTSDMKLKEGKEGEKTTRYDLSEKADEKEFWNICNQPINDNIRNQANSDNMEGVKKTEEEQRKGKIRIKL